MRMWIQSLALLCGLRFHHCCKLQYGSHMQLGSTVAVVVIEARSCSSYSTPSLGTSICCSYGCKKKKKRFWCLNFTYISSSRHLYSLLMIIDFDTTFLCGWFPTFILCLLSNFVIFFVFAVACGSSQVRGQMGTAAAYLYHSHSNSRSEPHLWPIP